MSDIKDNEKDENSFTCPCGRKIKSITKTHLKTKQHNKYVSNIQYNYSELEDLLLDLHKITPILTDNYFTKQLIIKNNISIKFIEKNLNFIWNFDLLYLLDDFNSEFFDKYYIYFKNVTSWNSYDKLSIDIIKKYYDICKFNKNILIKHKDMTYNTAISLNLLNDVNHIPFELNLYDIQFYKIANNKFWQYISQNVQSLDDVLNNPNYNWDWNQLSINIFIANPDNLLKYKTLPWNFNNISLIVITWDIDTKENFKKVIDVFLLYIDKWWDKEVLLSFELCPILDKIYNECIVDKNNMKPDKLLNKYNHIKSLYSEKYIDKLFLDYQNSISSFNFTTFKKIILYNYEYFDPGSIKYNINLYYNMVFIKYYYNYIKYIKSNDQWERINGENVSCFIQTFHNAENFLTSPHLKKIQYNMDLLFKDQNPISILILGSNYVNKNKQIILDTMDYLLDGIDKFKKNDMYNINDFIKNNLLNLYNICRITNIIKFDNIYKNKLNKFHKKVCGIKKCMKMVGVYDMEYIDKNILPLIIRDGRYINDFIKYI